MFRHTLQQQLPSVIPLELLSPAMKRTHTMPQHLWPESRTDPSSWQQCCDLETMVSRLECTQIHFVQVLVSRPEGPGLGLGLETWSPRSRSWSRDWRPHFFSCGAFLCALTILVWDQKFCWNLCMLSATCTWCRQSTWFLGVNQLWTLGLYFQLICKQSTDWTDVTLLG